MAIKQILRDLNWYNLTNKLEDLFKYIMEQASSLDFGSFKKVTELNTTTEVIVQHDGQKGRANHLLFKGLKGEPGPQGKQGEKGPAGEVGEAPSDGKQYARQDEAWSEVVSGGGGSLERVDLEDGTVAYKLDSNDLIPTTSSIDLRAGNQGTDLGTYAVCISAELPQGAENTSSGEFSTVSGGYSNTASGATSTISGGYSNTASGATSTVSGGNTNTASGATSTVSGGNSNTATNYSETVVGMFSDNTGEVQTTRVEGSPIFRIGIGTYNERKDGFIVTNEGNLILPEAGARIELKSPNGTAYTLTVSDDGELVITAV